MTIPPRTAPDRRSQRVSDWGGALTELVIFATCVTYLVTSELWALLLWEAVAAAYLIIGFAVVWRRRRIHPADVDEVRVVIRWLWVPPLLAAIAGANSAITALAARGDGTADSQNFVLMLAASAGIMLSWMLLQVGFSEMYQAVDAISPEPELRFPSGGERSTLDFLYFSFTIGTSFATSDVEILGFRTKRIALLHSVIAFFYNAIVVAVAFQILQGLVTR